MNVSLWTIRYEVLCYFAGALIVMAGLVRGRVGFLALFGGLSVISIGEAWFFPDHEIHALSHIIRFFTAFSLGMALFHWPVLRKPGWLGVGAAVVFYLLVGRTPFAEAGLNIAVAATMMHVGLVKWNIPFLRDMPDYSYGIYIWHFLIYQVLIDLYPNITLLSALGLCLIITLMVASISWHVIEKPILDLKARKK